MSKKKRPFTSSFYIIYVLLSLADIVNYLMSTLSIRLLQYNALPWAWLPHYGTVHQLISGYASFFEYSAHLVVAVNRYLTIAHPLNRIMVSGKRPFTFVLLALCAVPLLAAVRVVNNVQVGQSDSGYFLRGTNPWGLTISLYQSVGLSALTCLASFVLDIFTLYVYRGWSAQMRNERHDDYRLLLYAICSLISQSLIAAYYVVYTLATSPTLQFIAQSAVVYVVDLLTLSGPVRTVRHRFLEFYGLGRMIKPVKTGLTNSAWMV
ncbi:hypothetical protein AAVH_16197 [Aphelenchoides avenae]|nr:hypothetical protein AAVH_16197 [Aphelenchus avenae]